jgi:RNA polymerase sigma-70 factor (ECF subfamily)
MNENRPTDQELVANALRDKQEFSKIIERYQEPLRRYIMRLGCRDANDSQDILQETFIKVYLNLNGYDAELKFSSWLYRITHNETMTFFRKKKVQPVLLQHEDVVRLLENIADETDVSHSLHREQDKKKITEALWGLKAPYRNVLVLRFLEEKSYGEISDILKIPNGTVATLINRGKKQLKKVLLPFI